MDSHPVPAPALTPMALGIATRGRSVPTMDWRALPGSPDMKKLSTTKVLIETERVVTFRNYERQQPGWCFGCAAETQMATIAYAAREAGLSELATYQLLDAGALHFREDADGRVLVCLNSLCLTLRTAGLGSARVNSNQKGESYESDE